MLLQASGWQQAGQQIFIDHRIKDQEKLVAQDALLLQSVGALPTQRNGQTPAQTTPAVAPERQSATAAADPSPPTTTTSNSSSSSSGNKTAEASAPGAKRPSAIPEDGEGLRLLTSKKQPSFRTKKEEGKGGGLGDDEASWAGAGKSHVVDGGGAQGQEDVRRNEGRRRGRVGAQRHLHDVGKKDPVIAVTVQGEQNQGSYDIYIILIYCMYNVLYVHSAR